VVAQYAKKFDYKLSPIPVPKGEKRILINGTTATAIGKILGGCKFQTYYPITPASDESEYLESHTEYGTVVVQSEDEIAAVGAAIGASFGGQIGLTGTSGPGLCLKAEAMNLAVMTELPLVVIDAQRGGPSTGMPTKTEQTDLLQTLFGRNGESPIAVISPKTASDCFAMAVEAVRLALKYMTPVVLLTEADVINSAEPWKLPEIGKLPKIEVTHPTADGKPFLPYSRNPETLARPWAIPGTPGLEHRIGGLAKADLTGNVSYDGPNNEKMARYRAEKIARIANDIPVLEVRGPQKGKLLVLGWGGTYGPIYQAVSDLGDQGVRVSQAHLNYLNPFPKNLGEVLKQFEQVLIPELNSGQLLLLIRGAFPGTNAVGLHKIQCQPFKVEEITVKIKELA
jgi:2-oxoglutarate ferredoxin oxidoreductase subunit alpha